MRLTFGDIKATCARVLDLPPNDTRVAEYVNRAQERLMNDGAWVGTTARFKVCVNDSCLTWPREVETIEAFSVCGEPGTVRSEWYEFMGSGPGELDSTSCVGTQLIDMGMGCSYADPLGGADKRFKIFAEETEDTTQTVIIQHYDANGNWVRTNNGGSYIDGEAIAIPAKGNYSTGTKSIMKSGLVRIIKPATNGRLLLYEYDTVGATYFSIGQYQPSETRPVYRRSMIPGISADSTGSCSTVSVSILARLRHLPVENDNDFMILTLRDAISLECQAIRKEENNLFEEANAYSFRARQLLDKQLSKYRGTGMNQPFMTADPGVYGGAIESVM